MVESIPLSNAPPFSVSNRLNEMLLEQNRTEHIQWNAPLAAIVLKSPLDLPVVRTSPDHKTFNSPPMDAVRLISQYAHQIKNIHIPDKHRNTKKRFKQPSKLQNILFSKKFILAIWCRDRSKVTFQSKQQIWGTHTEAIYPAAWFWFKAPKSKLVVWTRILSEVVKQQIKSQMQLHLTNRRRRRNAGQHR